MEQISPQLQHQLAQFQAAQQQVQAIATQKLQFELQLREIDRALGEMEKLGSEAEIYKSVGAILIKSEKDKILVELKDKKETLDLRIKTLQKQEEKVQAKLKELQEKIQEQFKATKTGTTLGASKAG